MKTNVKKTSFIKKAAAVMTALALTFTFCITAFAADGAPPDMPEGGPSFSDQGGPGGAPGGGAPGSSGGVDSYDSVYEYSQDTEISGETIESTGSDENAMLISGGAIVIEDSTVTRVSDSSTGGDDSSFYGVGAAILATDGTAYISDTSITTDSKGGAGVFAYGDGVVYVADTVIETAQSTSGGIHAAGGGTLYAWNVTATTEGGSSAAIRSDRGGGTMVVDGGTYTSNGSGSPAIYCTADISVNDATLTATGSEAICIEGLNSLYLYDCDLTGNMPDDSQNDCTWTVILYQSMSGDSEVGCSTFQMQGGTLTSENGGLFYTTNTESNFYISDVDITAAKDCDFFLKVTGNSNQRGWGSTGSNGAQCTFTASSQEAEGDIIWDSISTLDFYLLGGSTLTGAVINDESNAGSGGSGYAALYIDSDSTWVVTADSTLTDLYCEGSIVDESGKTVTVRDANGNILVQGDSSITVTTENYSSSADLSGSVEAASWDSVSVARPEQLGTAQVETTVSEETETTTEAETIAETAPESVTESETSAVTEEAETVQQKEGLGTGAILGIIAGSAVVIAGIVVAIALSGRKKRN